MQIVIDVPEARYKDILRIASVQLNERLATPEQIIANGTPLPRGHGRLVDEDEVRDLLYEQEYNYFTELDKVCDTIGEATTLVEADYD